jgi:hypothetical protein
MQENVTAGDSDAPRPDWSTVSAIEDFVDFLDDLETPASVGRSLAVVLRTEPPVHVGVSRLVDLVASWARRRSRTSGRPASELLLGAVQRVVEAYRSDVLDGFDPREFYRPFALGLASACPPSEREAYHVGLRNLQEALPRRWSGDGEPFASDTLELRGKHVTLEDALEELVTRLESEPNMRDGRFEETLTDLERVLVARGGDAVQSALVRLAAVGVSLFNAVRVQRASRLYQAVADAIDRLQLSEDESRAVRRAIPSAALDEVILFKWVSTADRHPEIRPVVRHFADLDPGPALEALARETAREKRRFLLNVLLLHGADALPQITSRLAEPAAGATGWYLERNLLYLLSHIDSPSRGRGLAVVDLIGPYVTSPVPQLRSVALAALKRLGPPREALPYVVRALDPAAYGPGEGTADGDALRRHLKRAMEIIAGSSSPAALTVLAEVAVGARGEEFGLGGEARELAVHALDGRDAPLPRPAALVIAYYLRSVAGRGTRFPVPGFRRTEDAEYVAALARVISDSLEPEARAVFSSPAVRALVAPRGR